MEKGNTVYSFTYDPAGRPVSISDGSNRYYYVLNQQGDVVGLLDSNKELVVLYFYDAWGRIFATIGSAKDTLGANNPLRYRGYVYDRETGLYYLQSRYYNPTIGRFINADGQLSGVGGNIIGYNQFAYCFNNPVNRLDDTGTWPQWVRRVADWFVNKITKQTAKYIPDIAEDARNFNSNNQDADKVFSANYFSCYKGKLVIVTSFETSFSFGVIFLTKFQKDENTLNHEYGHTQQMEEMGANKYLGKVAIPSIIINRLSVKGKLQYDYYGAPWEAEADRLGGVNRTEDNTPWPENPYESIWDIIKLFLD